MRRCSPSAPHLSNSWVIGISVSEIEFCILYVVAERWILACILRFMHAKIISPTHWYHVAASPPFPPFPSIGEQGGCWGAGWLPDGYRIARRALRCHDDHGIWTVQRV